MTPSSSEGGISLTLDASGVPWSWAEWWQWDATETAALAQVPWSEVSSDIASRFLTRLSQIPALDQIVRSHSSYDRLEPLLREYLSGLGQPAGPDNHLERLREVGLRHVRLGLSPDLFQAAYWFLVQGTLDVLGVYDPMVHRAVLKRMAWDLVALSASQTSYFTFQDSLTEIPNRLATELQLNAYLRQRHPFALVLADLNEFKTINDTLGHGVGDQVLRAVAQRWAKALRRTDWVGRWGGDEFLLILAGVHSVQDLPALLRKFRSVVEPPIEVEGLTVQVTATLGVARYPHDGEAISELLRQADRALYRAKNAERGWMTAEGLKSAAEEPEDWVEILREALQKGRIQAFFQPIVDLRDGKVRGFEALMRYIDDVGQVHLPGEFLPRVNHPELLRVLDAVVLRQALEALSGWRRQGWQGFVSVNVASQEVTDPAWLSEVSHIRAAYPELPPSALHFEVLETAPLADFETVARMTSRIAEAGYRLSLDDFGTGYSSLAHVHRLPIHAVKIDQSFLRDWQTPQGRAVIQAIVGMSHPLGVEVVAEGVEEAGQREALKAWGCDAAQGWLFSPPLPRAEADAYLHR